MGSSIAKEAMLPSLEKKEEEEERYGERREKSNGRMLKNEVCEVGYNV